MLWSDYGFHLGEKEHIEKFALWEKTTHVPYIIVSPAHIQPRMHIDHPVDLTTVYSILAKLCGLDRHEVDGLS